VREAPLKIQDAAIRAACRYRDASLNQVTETKLARLRDQQQAAFNKLVRAMDCQGHEDYMVSENLGSIVAQIPVKHSRR
jgi:hypothetical protein